MPQDKIPIYDLADNGLRQASAEILIVGLSTPMSTAISAKAKRGEEKEERKAKERVRVRADDPLEEDLHRREDRAGVDLPGEERNRQEDRVIHLEAPELQEVDENTHLQDEEKQKVHQEDRGAQNLPRKQLDGEEIPKRQWYANNI